MKNKKQSGRPDQTDRTGQSGFTVLELVVVVASVLILITLAFILARG
jgi:type II secretory pathway pseudopilin PulG